ncbi:glycosyltransferase family 2 protein [Acinetobacter wuhouensis]|uniref:glycosyltransferase family 2 protein n=1 Tax=Acinetobacter wuhouensis TaxID=1879050 RepID=UPI00083AAEB1|nr:glycosyltransferase family 2 protein [Acinetobacter wuhouensis]AXQ23908.1 glycosyltransferase family 2 protein [Acinetobacter wuhouensis]
MINKSISVVIPFFKAEKTIENTLDSVVNQTLQPSDIIIVIDGCDDLYLKKICELKKFEQLRINLIKLNNNSGVSHARNIGVKLSNCEYIAFLDSDDVWHPQKLEIQLNLMQGMGLDFSFHMYQALPLSEFKKISSFSIKHISKINFIYKQFIATPTVMVKKSKFILFDEKISYCEDYLCWMMNMDERGFYMINEFLAHGYKPAIGFSGLSSSINKMHKGYVESNIVLLKNKKISFLFFLSSCFFEYFKYPLRYVRRIFGNKK